MIEEFSEAVEEIEKKVLKYTFSAPSKNDKGSMRGRGWEDAFVDSRLAMLHLSSAADPTAEKLSGDHPPLHQCHSCGSLKKQPHFSPEISTTTSAAAITAETPDPSPEKKTLYGGAATKAKRYSNCRFSSSLEEPFPKRTATLLPLISTTTSAGDTNNHHVLLLPISTTAGTGDTNGNNNNHFQGFIKIPLQESPIKSPNQCALTRTASWSPNVQELGGTVNNGESPTAMRLKRMKDGMKEMRQWCDLMIQEDVHEETEPEIYKILKDDETETREEALCEEAVSVERMGSCLILHFKCPCGKGYQILLCGNNCYYKLTDF
ncbi:hypothetical protein RND71_023166 [Anisodus tanguticus]|uniref:Uncharacterized protein n=1 Tax=Anisodus tanguticus TaxID=243964 RepID=A0AAE1RTE1_9SOLA|nr:hypothetical protein RND71_023166 [Anisodus tanguticus]